MSSAVTCRSWAPEDLTTFLAIFALALALGTLAEFLLYRFVIKGKYPDPGRSRLRWTSSACIPTLARRLVREMAGTFVFFIVGRLVLRFVMPERDAAHSPHRLRAG